MNPVAVPIHIGPNRFQLSAEQRAISTAITGGIENLDGRVVKSNRRDPFGAVPDVPILGDINEGEGAGRGQALYPANGIQIDFLPVQVRVWTGCRGYLKEKSGWPSHPHR